MAFSFWFTVLNEMAEVRLTARNAIHDIDGLGTLAGLPRHRGEQLKDYWESFHQASVVMHTHNRNDWAVINTGRGSTFSFEIESRDLALCRFVGEVTGHHKMKLWVDLYDGVQWNSQTFEYDLLDKQTFPFLKDLAHIIEQDVPLLLVRYEDSYRVRPYHLLAGQKKWRRGRFSLETDRTDWTTEHLFFLPSSIIFEDIQVDGKQTSLVEVASEGDLSNLEDVFFDPSNGRVVFSTKDIHQYLPTWSFVEGQPSCVFVGADIATVQLTQDALERFLTFGDSKEREHGFRETPELSMILEQIQAEPRTAGWRA